MDITTDNNLAVSANQLTKHFGSFTAVDRINLNVRNGEIFGFLGANGAGKTTAIRMFCGLLKPTSGEAWVDGLSVNTDSERVKQRIGYMSQRFSLYEDLTVMENLTFFGGVYGLKRHQTDERAEPLLERLELKAWRRRLTRDLPLGFKQRLALGCATLHNPRILFLDEPTGGVDPAARREFWDLIYSLAEAGSTVFVTTHYMDEAEYCHRISIMKDGAIVALDSPSALKSKFNRNSLQEVFFKAVAG